MDPTKQSSEGNNSNPRRSNEKGLTLQGELVHDASPVNHSIEQEQQPKGAKTLKKWSILSPIYVFLLLVGVCDTVGGVLGRSNNSTPLLARFESSRRRNHTLHLPRALIPAPTRPSFSLETCNESTPFHEAHEECRLNLWESTSSLYEGQTLASNNSSFRDELISLIQLRSPATSFANSSSPQSKALNWMLTQDEYSKSFLSNSNDRLVQRFALATFWYSARVSENYPHRHKIPDSIWLNATAPECEWNSKDFEACSSDGFVTSLKLSAKVASHIFIGWCGSLPIEVGLLTTLESLNLSSSRLIGSLPTELGHLTGLKVLDVGRSQLNGGLPTELGQLTSLTNLDFFANNFMGSLPTELGQLTGLKSLSLSMNHLTGSLPTELGHLTGLEVLDLYINRLNGGLPTELAQLTGLKSLHLGLNRFNGTVPPEWGQLTGLASLDVQFNALIGTVPTEWGQLTAHLSLYNNSLVGTLPSTLCRNVDRFGLPLRLRIDCAAIGCECCMDNEHEPCREWRYS